MSIIVIDGISVSGKSVLLKALQRRVLDLWPNYSKLVLTEHLTERLFERRNASPAQVHLHVARVLRLAAELKAMQAEGPFSDNGAISTIMIERLFLTLMSRGLMTASFFSEHAVLVDSVELKSVFLFVPLDQIKDRIAQSLTHRKAGWIDFIASLGGVEGAAASFEKQQDEMRHLNENLRPYMQTQTIEVADTAELFVDATLDGILCRGMMPAPGS
jgi:predicted ATPase